MPYFGQDLFLRAEEGPLTDDGYLEAVEKNHRLSRKEGIDAAMDKDKLDALVAPTRGPGVGDGPGPRRRRPRRQLVAGGGGGLSQYHRAGGIRVRPAGGDIVLRPGVERADAAATGLRLRASDEARKPPRFLPTADLRE